MTLILQHIDHTVSVSQHETFRDATVFIDGDLEISGEGVVEIAHCDLTIAGRLLMRDAAQLQCRDSMLRFSAKPIFEATAVLSDSSTMQLSDTIIDSLFAFPAVVLTGQSRVVLENVRPETNQLMISPWWVVFGESALHAVSSHISGCIGDAGRLTAAHHSQVRLEFLFGKGAQGELHVINRPVDHLTIPDFRLTGVDWSCELTSGSLLAGWYTDHRAGSDITVVGARGLYPAYVWEGKQEQIENLKSGIYADQEWLHNDCRIRLVDSLVSRWTCWVTHGSDIALRNCDILDYMVWDHSVSTCEDSTIVLAGAKNDSRAQLRRCHLLTPDWGGSLSAGGNAQIELHECTVDGSARAVDGGVIHVGSKPEGEMGWV